MERTDAIAAALSRVRARAQARDAQIVHSAEISRTDREFLLSSGWLQEVIRGWYMLVRPDVATGDTGDTAAWYANFWDFVRIYLQHRFGNDYCLNAESSLDLHTENPTVPKQVIVIVKQGAGLRKLMHDTSLMMYADPNNFPAEITQKQGINVMTLPYALCKVSPTYFLRNARDVELALRTVQIPAEISRLVIRFNLKAAAARLMGAYQFLRDDEKAMLIKNDLDIAGIAVIPENPFQQAQPLLTASRIKSPYAGRIQAMWSEARDAVIGLFPKPPGLPRKSDAYLRHIEEIYQYDAYNSLSIEGYHVTHELIHRVQSNQWHPEANQYDRNESNALAARGYFDAFQHVKGCIARILKGENAAQIVSENLQAWYQKLFGPSAQAGIIPQEGLIGYRSDRVFIRNSRHAPPPKEAVVDAMETFFECLHAEDHPGVNGVLGHYFFVFIHPYMDGNGRLGRFLMNALLASGGYPWTVVRVERRNEYISTLEETHIQFDMRAFARFIVSEMNAQPQ